jgi:phage repressor protein C with HTH and peptisase S24 domain
MLDFAKESISNKIREIRDKKKWSQEDLAREIDVSKGTVQNAEAANPLISSDLLLRIVNICEDEKDKLYLLENAGIKLTVNPNSHGEESAEGESPYIYVPRFNIHGGMGPGFDIHSEQVIDHLAFKRDWIKARGLNPEKLALIDGIGDSMSGFLENKDLLLIDLRPAVRRDGIFALYMDGGLVVKFVQWTPEKIIVRSKNEDIYKPVEYDRENPQGLRIVGRVVWFGREI